MNQNNTGKPTQKTLSDYLPTIGAVAGGITGIGIVSFVCPFISTKIAEAQTTTTVPIPQDATGTLIWVIVSLIAGISWVGKAFFDKVPALVSVFSELKKALDRNTKVLIVVCQKLKCEDEVKILWDDEDEGDKK